MEIKILRSLRIHASRYLVNICTNDEDTCKNEWEIVQVNQHKMTVSPPPLPHSPPHPIPSILYRIKRRNIKSEAQCWHTSLNDVFVTRWPCFYKAFATFIRPTKRTVLPRLLPYLIENSATAAACVLSDLWQWKGWPNNPFIFTIKIVL